MLFTPTILQKEGKKEERKERKERRKKTMGRPMIHKFNLDIHFKS